jgi:polysaccharide pyruvyl transferase WcaK-like protein
MFRDAPGNLGPAPLRLVLIGAAPDTGNLGVSALCESVVHTIGRLAPETQITVFDNGRGNGPATIADLPVHRQGLRHSRRLYEPSSLIHAQLSLVAGGMFENPIARSIREADAALDLTGGDSFSDIYGQRRFRQGLAVKQFVLRCGTPLVLLPQTYGPFADDANRRQAADVVRQASMAWARDAKSFGVLQQLAAGGGAAIHSGVDVAVALPTTDQGIDLDGRLAQWIDQRSRRLVGLNVSGLLYNAPQHNAQRYGLKADYPAVMRRLAERLLEKPDVNLLLVPHVVGEGGDRSESDIAACRSLSETLGEPRRVAVAPAPASASRAKWLISRCDWFCGTRMHATIAALSTATPVAAIAYSPKTRGVFDTFAVGPEVADPRQLSTQTVVDALVASYERRAQTGATLQRTAPRLREQADQQMRQILEHCQLLAAPASGVREAQPA